jgi:hypothetical protein
LRIWSLERDIAAQAEKQRQLRESNAIGHADVEDLRSGLGAVEERARREIGMVRKDETFFQYPQQGREPGESGSFATRPAGDAGTTRDERSDHAQGKKD